MNTRGMFPKQRSFAWIPNALTRSARMWSGKIDVDVLGTVRYGTEEYGLWYAVSEPQRRRGRQLPTILVTAGVHGNEPAGVDAAMRFLSEHVRAYDGRCRIVLLPCVNPSGYEAATRENAAGIDVNRSFGTTPGSREAELIMGSWLAEERFLLTVDLHETLPDEENGEYGKDDNPTSFYMYETCRSKRRRVARHVLRAVEGEGGTVCARPTIYGDDNAGGVVWYPEACKNAEYVAGTSLDAWFARGRTPNAIVTETPAWQRSDRRTTTQVVALRAAIDETLRRYPRQRAQKKRRR